MGNCLTTTPSSQPKLSNHDYHLIWNRCITTEGESPWPIPRGEHPAFQQITKDIDRTFPQHPYFNQPPRKLIFERVLRGFALHLPRVGYTQGLNFLAGFLLLSGLGESQALCTLVGMCVHPELLLLGVYQDQFPLCKIYCDVFWRVLTVVAPRAYQKLQAAGLPDEVWIFQWFISLFVYCFPLSYLMEMLNFIIVKRFLAPVRLAVGIIQCLEPYLLQLPRGQDSLLECFELVRSEQFCDQYMPLKSVLRAAERIKKGVITQALSRTPNHHFYKYYFMGTKQSQSQKHKRFMQDLSKERSRFKQPDQGQRYSRVDSSLRVIDYINEQQHQRMSRVWSTTNKDNKNPPIFSNIGHKKYNSVNLDRQSK